MAVGGPETHAINEKIRARSMRVITDDGEQLGILDKDVALQMARERGVDLVEVAPTATPPVCKLMDYGKFKYQQKKKNHEARRKQSVISVKEVKFRPQTDDHDYDYKVRNARRFLEEGDKVKIKVFFRGREMIHPAIGERVLRRVIEDLSGVAKLEAVPQMDGGSRQMFAILAPMR